MRPHELWSSGCPDMEPWQCDGRQRHLLLGLFEEEEEGTDVTSRGNEFVMKVEPEREGADW